MSKTSLVCLLSSAIGCTLFINQEGSAQAPSAPQFSSANRTLPADPPPLPGFGSRTNQLPNLQQSGARPSLPPDPANFAQPGPKNGLLPRTDGRCPFGADGRSAECTYGMTIEEEHERNLHLGWPSGGRRRPLPFIQEPPRPAGFHCDGGVCPFESRGTQLPRN